MTTFLTKSVETRLARGRDFYHIAPIRNHYAGLAKSELGLLIHVDCQN